MTNYLKIVGAPLICVVTLCPAANAQDADAATSSSPATGNEAATPIEVYQGPRVIKTSNPKYPPLQQRTGGEGWVVMQFMVDTAGKPYEISVADSAGDDSFAQAATKALKRFNFEPAMADGKPIDAGYHQKITFALQGGANGANRNFIRHFRALAKAVDKSDKAQADELFAKLEISNLYEDAFYNYMKANYYARWGTPRQQLGALRRAVAHEESAKYLPEENYLNALQRRFSLELQLNDFAAGEASASLLLTLDVDDEYKAKLHKALAELAALKNTAQPFAVAGSLNNNTSWWFKLFRNTFHVEVQQGTLAELKLRCRKGYVFFRYDPELQYTIPEDRMPCGLEILGDPGTTFSVVQ